MPGMEIELTGKTALVTGASRGLGQAMALAFARCGAHVIGVGTAIESNPSTMIADAKNLGGSFRPLNCDLSSRTQIEAMVATLDAEGAAVDILVNNAGIIRRADAALHSNEDWDAVMAVNIDAVFILSREFGRRMLERGAGKIINIASVLSFQGGLRVPGYAASKGAIRQLTQSFANEWAAKGVNVNAVAPGYIATDNTQALQDDPARSKELIARVPAGRWGDADDIAGPVVFLASDLANFIHGVVLPVDGGWLSR